MKERLLFSTYLAPNLRPVYQFVTDYVGKELGIETTLVAGKSYRQVSHREAQVYFICGLPYVLLGRGEKDPLQPIAAPILKGKRYQDKPIYFSDVITRKEAVWDSFEDLRGRSWSYNEPMSQSGYGITLYTLLSMGETKGFFGKVIQAGYHQKSIELVMNGEVDASAIDSHLLSVELRENPTLTQSLKIIDTLGPSTIQPVAVDIRLPEDLVRDIQSVIVKIDEAPEAREILDFGFIDRFVEVDSSSYDDIRAMRAACEHAGFTRLV